MVQIPGEARANGRKMIVEELDWPGRRALLLLAGRNEEGMGIEANWIYVIRLMVFSCRNGRHRYQERER